jgi:hypothetical protein
LEIIEKWLNDSDCDVRRAAMNACNGRDIPVEIIEKWLNDSDCDVRQAAMNACNGRDIPVEIIEMGLKDSNWRVRRAAMNALGDRKIITRTIDPPEKVYKKCYNDIIVVATIPDDAHIRGQYGQKCRASKAKIIDIIGEFGGEKIGISKYDGQTCYFIGDEIEIDNFDMSQEICSTGFHFFCTKEEAEDYL